MELTDFCTRTKAVSYTHLDVYKRQDWIRGIAESVETGIYGWPAFNAAKKLVIISTWWSPNTRIGPVSYTHLPTTSPEKDKAKENLDKQVQDAKDAIDKDDNLTDDQKQAAKDQIDTDAKNAQDAIDNAKNDADVNNAADNGKLAIDKTVADAAIDNAVAGKIKDCLLYTSRCV